MSYILDALRRAEAERERGGVPGVHSEQFPTMPDDDDTPRRSSWLVVAIVVLSLALTAALAWNLFAGRGATASSATTVASGAVTPAPPASMPLAASSTTAAALAGATSAASTSVAPASAAATPATPSSATASAVRAPRERRRAAPEPKSRGGDAEPARAGERVYAEAELPAEARRALPKLSFGGSSYSSAASSRMVIWNGRVFHEGDTIAPDVVLRRIDRKSAQLAVKGLRVDVPF